MPLRSLFQSWIHYPAIWDIVNACGEAAVVVISHFDSFDSKRKDKAREQMTREKDGSKGQTAEEY